MFAIVYKYALNHRHFPPFLSCSLELTFSIDQYYTQNEGTYSCWRYVRHQPCTCRPY